MVQNLQTENFYSTACWLVDKFDKLKFKKKYFWHKRQKIMRKFNMTRLFLWTCLDFFKCQVCWLVEKIEFWQKYFFCSFLRLSICGLAEGSKDSKNSVTSGTSITLPNSISLASVTSISLASVALIFLAFLTWILKLSLISATLIEWQEAFIAFIALIWLWSLVFY